MKRLLCLLSVCALLPPSSIQAQGMKVLAGTTFKAMEGRYTLVVKNASFNTEAPLLADSLVIRGAGNNAVINATAPLTLHSIEVGMNTGKAMLLQQNVQVHNLVLFSSGFLDLNGRTVFLDSAARLSGEQDLARAIAPNGGEVEITQTLDGPLAENPGNLGMIITSGANLGVTTIRRGHQVQSGTGTGVSIARYYDIVPEFNANLGAILRAYYLSAELNGQLESQLRFSRSTDSGQHWTNAGVASLNTTQNYANLSGVQSMGRFTLSDIANPLPVRLLRWEGNCDGHIVTLKWETIATPDIHRYSVEESDDAREWRVAGTKTATAASSYTLTDETPASWYRLVSHSSNGQDYFSNLLRISCGAAADRYELLQQPVKEVISIRTALNTAMAAQLKLIDLQGRILYSAGKLLPAGSAISTIDVSGFAAGTYQLILSGKEGTAVWQTKVIVQ